MNLERTYNDNLCQDTSNLSDCYPHMARIVNGSEDDVIRLSNEFIAFRDSHLDGPLDVREDWTKGCGIVTGDVKRVCKKDN